MQERYSSGENSKITTQHCVAHNTLHGFPEGRRKRRAIKIPASSGKKKLPKRRAPHPRGLHLEREEPLDCLTAVGRPAIILLGTLLPLPFLGADIPISRTARNSCLRHCRRLRRRTEESLYCTKKESFSCRQNLSRLAGFPLPKVFRAAPP